MMSNKVTGMTLRQWREGEECGNKVPPYGLCLVNCLLSVSSLHPLPGCVLALSSVLAVAQCPILSTNLVPSGEARHFF